MHHLLLEMSAKFWVQFTDGDLLPKTGTPTRHALGDEIHHRVQGSARGSTSSVNVQSVMGTVTGRGRGSRKRGKGRGKGSARSADCSEKTQGARKRAQVKEKEEGRRTFSDTPDSTHLRDVRYSAEEDEALMRAFQSYCADKHIEEEEMTECVVMADKTMQAHSNRFWSEITERSGLKRRSVKSITFHLRRRLEGTQRWTDEEKDLLLEKLVTHGYEWSKISKMLGKGYLHTRDAGRFLLTARKGKWTDGETRLLRLGILKETGQSVPVQEIPWSSVAKHVPGRDSSQCLQRWYKYVQPPAPPLPGPIRNAH